MPENYITKYCHIATPCLLNYELSLNEIREAVSNIELA